MASDGCSEPEEENVKCSEFQGHGLVASWVVSQP